MKKIVKTASLALAAVLACSACSGGGGRTTNTQPAGGETAAADTAAAATTTTVATLKEEQQEVVDSIEIEGAEKLANPVVKWLSFWDLNPTTEGEAMLTELQLFEKNYGGSIEWIKCTFDDRFDRLATMVSSGQSPDLFPAKDDIFPRAFKALMPIDDYVDLSDPIWSDMLNLMEFYTIDGKHYSCIMNVEAECLMIYNKNTIAENGLPDPVELLDQGKWDWDALWDMMVKFCDTENEKYAVDGWWFEGLISLSTGVPYIGYENGRLVSNLNDPMLAKAQDYMLKMNREEFPFPLELKVNGPSNGYPANIGLGKTLFYPVGQWRLYSADMKDNIFGETGDVMFVPFPKCPDADAHYLSCAFDAMAMVGGSTNPEGAAAFLKCRRTANLLPETKAIGVQQALEDYGWSEEMVEMLDRVKEMVYEHPIFEFYNAGDQDLADYINNPMKEAYNYGVAWSETAAAYSTLVEKKVKALNESLLGITE